MVKSSVHWTREFPAGISGILAAGRTLWSSEFQSQPPHTEFQRDFPAFPPFFWILLRAAPDWERKIGNFGDFFWEFCSFLGISRGWEKLFSHREFPGKIHEEFPKHSSPKLGFFPIFSWFFPGFSQIFGGLATLEVPESRWEQPGTVEVSLPLGLGPSRGFSSPKFGNLIPKFQTGEELGLKFQNIPKYFGVGKENLDFLSGILGISAFPTQENSKEKFQGLNWELLHPRGFQRGKKIWEFAPQKTQKWKKSPIFHRDQNSWSKSWDSQIPRMGLAQGDPKYPQKNFGIKNKKKKKKRIWSLWKLWEFQKNSGFGNFWNFFLVFWSCNPKENSQSSIPKKIPGISRSFGVFQEF